MWFYSIINRKNNRIVFYLNAIRWLILESFLFEFVVLLLLIYWIYG